MRSSLRHFVVFVVVGLVSSAAAAPIIVETPALTPEQQRAKFKLPPGFEIQLISAEPDIGKPMNLNFDARGRLWITHSLEYPFPTEGEGVQPRDLNQDMTTNHAPRDHLSYFESIGPEGLGKGLTHFAEGLNIPIGQLPVVWNHEQTFALNYSIPSLRLYQRTASGGLADSVSVLFTGFGNVDTHGMCSSFTRGFDGWVYACHGFRNTSHIARPGGPELLMLNSGNTIRFKPDGSALEQFTRGQVNPFGMTFDTWGNLYNADCHSMPVTQLLRGATYQSFGKPDDGLGFGPDMIDHNHGSTGICGVQWYDAPQFPADFRDCLYICNPVNGQVHRDKLVWTGSSPKVSTQPEFITCDDGWFRPVDVKLGPDGALYIADFYNAIIGHYEAPLQHPKRDRTHARLWRVVYTGTDTRPAAELPDLTTLDDAALIARLGDANFTTRMLATNLLVDRYRPPVTGKNVPQANDRGSAIKALERVLASSTTSPAQVVHAAWAWSRLREESDSKASDIPTRLTQHSDAVVRAHAAKILGATSNAALVQARPKLLASLLQDSNPRVRRASVEALALHPEDATLPALLDAYEAAEAGDTHLKYAIRIALRSRLLRHEQTGEDLASYSLDRQRVLAGVTPAVNPMSPKMSKWLRDMIVQQITTKAVPAAEWRQWIKPAARSGDGSDFESLVNALIKASGDDLPEHLANVRAVLAGRQAGGLESPSSLVHWAERLSMQLIAVSKEAGSRWTYRSLAGDRQQKSPFGMQPRALAGKRGRTPLISSLPGGEMETGIDRSAEFTIPDKFSFWLAGHNSEPLQPDAKLNLVRLVDAKTGAVLKEAYPPRNDTARQITWDLPEHAGKQGAFEIVDAHRGTAYAWLAAGEFSVRELNPPSLDAGPTAVALIRDFKLHDLEPRLESLLLVNDAGLRSAAAGGLVALKPDARLSAVLLWSDDSDVPPKIQSQMWTAVRTRDSAALAAILRELLAGATSDRQRKVADLLVTDRAGAELLLKLAEEGRLSLQLLQQPALKFKLAALKVPELNDRATELTKSLPAPDIQLALLIAARKKAFDVTKCSTENGKTAFTKRCAICHQIGTEGAKVGPQLDGVGIRGLDRLLEDVLDPNRNVDAAFRSSAIALSDGRILTGLKRREEGADI
ncbi:MAG TPA: HEAT repeat domain-containing protein, partial [Caulifigura sp.]|nr:HEAT repeat domain-containing protein [Caulifigura sp.]